MMRLIHSFVLAAVAALSAGRAVGADSGTLSVPTKTWCGQGDGQSWDDLSNWSPAGVPAASDIVEVSGSATVCIPHAASCLSLRIGSSATLFVGGKSDIECPVLFDPDELSDRTLTVTEDLSIEGKAAFGALNDVPETRVNVGGNLSISGSAVVNAFAGIVESDLSKQTWQDYKKGGASFTIGGDLSVADSAKVTVRCHRESGMPVVWNVASNVTVGAQAQFNGSTWSAVSGNAYISENCTGYGWGGENGLGYADKKGGAYGGNGGNSNTKTYGFAYAPYYPGSPGYGDANGAQGGGAVRIAAGGTIRLDGTINVTGGRNKTGGNNYSAGSGGSVWLTCSEFVPGTSASIIARGGQAHNHYTDYAGGGGRVAIMTGAPTEAQLAQLYETGTCDDMLVIAEDMNDATLSPWPTLVDVTRGLCYVSRTYPQYEYVHGKPGTAVCLQNSAGKCVVTVTGNRETLETQPVYGKSTVAKGMMTFRAPEYLTVVAAQTRAPCLGYSWSNVKGESGEGVSNEFTIDIKGDTTVNWSWGGNQHRLSYSSGGMGSVSVSGSGWYDEGAVAVLTAVPADGRSFDQWVGSFDYADGANKKSVLNLTMDRPHEAVALFTGAAARTVTWTGTAGSDWFDPENWDADTIPTKADAVVVVGGTVQVRYPAAIDVRSFEISGDASVFVGAETNVTKQYPYEQQRANICYTLPVEPSDGRPYTFSVSGNYVQCGASKVYFGGEATSNRIEISVGGNMTITGDTSGDRARFQLYASDAESLAEVNRFRKGGARLTVGGDLTIDGFADFTPVVHRFTGAAVPVRARNVTVGVDAIVDADARGYGRRWTGSGTLWSSEVFGPGVGSGRAGASYGGKGTANSKTESGYRDAPFHAGSAARCGDFPDYVSYLHSGGGAVRIHAVGTFTLNGKIYADGVGRYGVAGGSGGGVWLTCDRFRLGSAAYISVRGGRSVSYKDNGGGSGGRIAIGVKFSDAQLDQLYGEGTMRKLRVTNLSEIGPAATTDAGRKAYARYKNDWTGRIRIDGERGFFGTSGVDAPDKDDYGNACYRAESGTAVLVEPPPGGMSIILR